MSVASRRKLLSIIVISIVIALLVWVSHTVSLQNGLNQLNTSNQQQLEQFIGHLDSQLARFQFLPNLIAKNQILVELLKNPQSTPRVDLVNHFLEDINTITGASDTYLMDGQGLTLAASNWQSKRPFVGRNFSFRPYFTEAMSGQLGRYFALGTTSGKRGYYFAYPIKYAADNIGVIVIKMDLSNIELRWSGRDSQFIVSDPNGIIFITTEADWLYKSIKTLTPQIQDTITRSRRYADNKFKLLGLHTQQQISATSSIVQLPKKDTATKTEYLTLTQNMPDAGWSVMILAPLKNIKQNSLQVITVLLLVLLLLMLSGLLSWQRHKRRLEKERFQLESQKLLEHKVSVRTKDLTQEVEQHKQTEKILRETQGELIQTAKLAVLGELSASISHELNNPLAAIRSYADNARQFLTLNKLAKADENLGRIAGLTERMAKISSQLKFFARKSSGNLELIKIKTVIKTAIDIVTPQSKRNQITINTIKPQTTLMAMADTIQLEQVLINLINNAMNAIETQTQGHIDIISEQQKEWILIHVDDNGPGINSNHLDKIFDPFFTTRESGLGLGLSISARIINGMNGHLSATNLPDSGARLTISLPAVEKTNG